MIHARLYMSSENTQKETELVTPIRAISSYMECPQDINPPRKESKHAIEYQKWEQIDTGSLIDRNITSLQMVILRNYKFSRKQYLFVSISELIGTVSSCWILHPFANKISGSARVHWGLFIPQE